MNWNINGIRIFVNESKEDAGQILPRIQPLSGGTVVQVFGYESDIRNISGLVVGNTDKNAIKNLVTGGSFSVGSPEGSLGSFQVKGVTVNRVPCVCQTIRPDLNEDSPVYKVDIQLYE